MLYIRKETNYKPSIAILRTLEGLETQGKREDFIFNMATFGSSYEGLCYGCAATACLQEIANFNLNETTIKSFELRAQALNFDILELLSFEKVIDEARIGKLQKLGKFYSYDLFEEEKELQAILAAKGFIAEDALDLPVVKETLTLAYKILHNSGK